MVVQEVFGWARRRRFRDGFCGKTGHLKANAHSPACPAGSGAGSDSAYLWMGGSDREDGCGEPESAGRRMKTQRVERSSFDLRIHKWYNVIGRPAGVIPKSALLGRKG